MMRKLEVGLTGRTYPIVIGRSPLESALFSELMVGRYKRAVVVTNDTVAPLYADNVTARLAEIGITSDEIILPDGEKHKTQATLASIYDQLIELKADRNTMIIALGGGVVGDVAGFAAATYQRGLPLVQMPTTLLSQVDSSVGGKTAVNHPAGKNMIGAFYQPKAVFIDLDTISTLPEREFRAGMAEVVKYGAIMDADFFSWLELNAEQLMAHDFDSLGYAVQVCCASKAKIVEQDETEMSSRALLNFGHTFGHAIEAGLGYGEWLHGEAVAAGMVLAGQLSVLSGELNTQELNRLRELLNGIGLPTSAPKLGVSKYRDLMGFDKKVLDGRLRLILLRRLGEAYVTSEFSDKLLNEVLQSNEVS
jgi:3-dehydroquinate synthase